MARLAPDSTLKEALASAATPAPVKELLSANEKANFCVSRIEWSAHLA